jgi:hypothetical protein
MCGVCVFVLPRAKSVKKQGQMGNNLSSREDRSLFNDRRGVRGLMDDISTINKLAPCFRKDDCQLLFASLTAIKGGLTDGNYRENARIGVKRVKLDGTDAVSGGSFKPLTYKQFVKVLKRMQAEADVALQV